MCYDWWLCVDEGIVPCCSIVQPDQSHDRCTGVPGGWSQCLCSLLYLELMLFWSCYIHMCRSLPPLSALSLALSPGLPSSLTPSLSALRSSLHVDQIYAITVAVSLSSVNERSNAAGLGYHLRRFSYSYHNFISHFLSRQKVFFTRLQWFTDGRFYHRLFYLSCALWTKLGPVPWHRPVSQTFSIVPMSIFN